MKMTCRLLSLLLVLAMVLTMLPATARAEESTLGMIPGTIPENVPGLIFEAEPEAAPDELTKADPEARIVSEVIPFRVNPLYEGLYEPDLEDIPQLPEPGQVVPQGVYYQSEAEAAKTIRKNMKNRTETYTIYVYSTKSDYNQLFSDLLNVAVKHTGVGTEGDYLMWQLVGWGGEVSRTASGKGYNYTYTYVTPYYTTAAQEKELTTAVNNLISSLGVKKKSDYEKVCAVYDWLCDNVAYDYDNLEDTSYKLKFTAYAALVNRTAVCQGYALLFYRLMLELGVDARFIGGDGGGPHAWNIVQLGDYYYNLDATWDAGYDEYTFFLQSTSNFLGHYRDPEFDTWEFHMDHPMAGENYDQVGTATLDPYINMGYCGTEENEYLNAVWVMMRDGTLVIEGEGKTLDYKTDGLPYWYYWIDHIESAEIGEGITKVGNYAFYQATAMKEVSLPESLTEIGKYAFAESGLEAVDIPDSATNVGAYAFYQAASLKQVSLPKGMTMINSYTFAGTGLETVEIPAGVKLLQSSEFQDCYALKSITFPEGLAMIGGSAFKNCDALTSLSFPSTLNSIVSDAFSNCDGLTEVTIPESVTHLWSAFESCKGLTKVTLNNKGDVDGFYGCTKLTDITFGPNIGNIGSGAFSGCTGLKEVTIPSHVGDIGTNAFKGCTGLETARLYNSGVIVQSAFQDCTSLKNVELQNVTSINQSAFRRCALESITLPASVRGIGTWAFVECSELKEITFLGDAPSFNVNAFSTITATAYYPAGNKTWTEKVMQNYGGIITWVPYTPPCSGHSYEAVVTAPTCQAQGYTTYTCTMCGDSYVDDYTDPVDHSYEEGTCIWCGEETYTIQWLSGTTSLNGTIDLNIYVALSENLLDEEDAFIRFTHSGITVDVPVSEGIEDMKKDTVCYRYSCEIFAKQVADTVTVQVMKGDEVIGDTLEYSVMKYCLNQIKKSTNQELVAVCKAMLNYAAASQLSFDYNTDNLANASLSDADKVLPQVDASAYKYNITGTEEGIKASSATLMLESEVKIRVYFKLTGDKTIDEFTFTIDGREVEVRQNDKGYYIETDGIAAKHLEQMHEFCVGGITVNYGALSYVNSKLSSAKETELNKNLAKALYAYWQAAESYLG